MGYDNYLRQERDEDERKRLEAAEVQEGRIDTWIWNNREELEKEYDQEDPDEDFETWAKEKFEEVFN